MNLSKSNIGKNSRNLQDWNPKEKLAYLKIILFSKTFGANVAFMDFPRLQIVVLVLPLVLNQISSLGETLGALLTLIRCLASVHPDMVFKVPFLFKDFVAIFELTNHPS